MEDALLTVFTWTGGAIWLALFVAFGLWMTGEIEFSMEHHNIKDKDANP